MRKRNLRKKAVADDDAVQHDTPLTGTKGKGVLSFDLEEEPPLPAVKKKTERQKQTSVKKQTPKTPLTSTQVSTSGSYTPEKLEELKKQSKGIPQVIQDVSPVLKISGTFKPVTAKPAPPDEAFVRVGTESTSMRDHGQVEMKVQEELDDHFVPPNVQTIQTAKKKRERLRQAQLAPDYLPLGGASNLLSQDARQHESRPSSESDAEEDHMRLQFIGATSSKHKVLDEEMDLDLMEDEDAVDSFVDAQIKKGIAAMGTSDQRKTRRKKAAKGEMEREEVCVLPVVSRSSLADCARQIRENLSHKQTQLQSLGKETESNLQSTQQRLQEALSGMERLKEEADALESRYREVQELRDYVADLCACLKEKLPFIEEMEDHLQEMYDEQSATLAELASMDQEDHEMADVSSNAVLEVMAADGTLDQASEASEAAMHQHEIDTAKPNDPEETQKASLRSQKRKRRWEASLHSASVGDYDIQKDQLNSVSTTEQLREVIHTVKELFSDVLPDFSSVRAITSRFEDLKERHPRLYDMAYIPDSLPALLAPFVRCELLSWSPMHGTSLGLESHSWYKDLETFGSEKEEHIVPEIVKRIVLPSARMQIQKCWTPFHFPQSQVVTEMVREMLVYVPMEDSEMQKLLQMVQRKLSDAVVASGVPPYSRPALTASIVIRSVVEVKFRLALHLVGSLCCFLDVVPIEILKHLVMAEVVCDKLLPFLRGLVHQPVDAIRKIVQIFSRIHPALLRPCDSAMELMQISDVMNALGGAAVQHRKEVTSRQNARILMESFVELNQTIGNEKLALSLKKSFL